MDLNWMKSEAVIMLVIGGIILLIILAAIFKGNGSGSGSGKSGCEWIIGLIIAGILAYLYISGDIIKSVP